MMNLYRTDGQCLFDAEANRIEANGKYAELFRNLMHWSDYKCRC